MGKKGGGGGAYDTSGLERATAQANKLNERIYEETRADVQPWYRMGTGSVSKLSDLLGITDDSVQSRDDIYNNLMPQYTTSSESQNSGMLLGADGRIYSSDMTAEQQRKILDANRYNERYAPTAEEFFSSMGGTTSSTDYDALNAAVDAQYASQGDTPEGYGSLLEKFDETKFKDSAGYKFRQDEAQKALERQMAAQGVTLGGGGAGEINPQAYRAMNELTQGLASQEYGNEYNRYVSDQLNTFNMLMTAGMGQGATNTMAEAGQNYTNAYGQNVQGLASAQQNAQLAQASQPSMFGQLLGAGAQLGSAAIFASDISTKENIAFDGVDNGHNMYQFNYIGDDKRYRGVMAQEVELTHPEAVIDIDGVKHVNYDVIGATMTEVN